MSKDMVPAHTSSAVPRRIVQPLYRRIPVFIATIVLVSGAITMLIPFLWMLSTSLTDPGLIFSRGTDFLPRRLFVLSEGQEVRVVPLQLEFETPDGKRITHAALASKPGRQRTVRWEGEKPEILRYQVRVAESGGNYEAGDRIWIAADKLRARIWLRWENYSELIRSSSTDKVPDEEIPWYHFLTRLLNWIQAEEPAVRIDFLRWIYNSFKITILATFGTLLSCSMAAYAFAVLQFPFKRLIFSLLLSTLMIPVYVTLIPIYVLFSRIGWVDTHLPLIVPAFFGNAFGVFLLRQFFLGLPKDLFDAARIDGAGPYRVYWSLVLPLSKPALATLLVFTFMGNWNNLIAPLVYLNSPEKMPLTAGLVYFQSSYLTLWHWFMAGALLSVIPMLVVFFFAQKYFVRGVVLSGLKT